MQNAAGTTGNQIALQEKSSKTMKNAIVIGTLGVAISLAMLAFGYLSGAGNASPTASPSIAMAQGERLERGEIEAVVRDYLVGNPEILIEMQAALESRQEEAQRMAQVDTIKNASGTIFNASYDGLIGNPAGTVTIVEFFDYNCGYCKRALDDMMTMMEADPKLKFVLKEFPVLGPGSLDAAKISIAVRMQDQSGKKYLDFHRRLLGTRGEANRDRAMAAAKEAGLNMAQIERDLKSEEIDATLLESVQLADALGISGTPSYVIGGEVVPGAVGHATLMKHVQSVRKCGTVNC